jgi:type I restriction enzyme, S subunit
MQAHFDSLTAGATLKTVGMPDVKRLSIPVPPLIEQDEIIIKAQIIRSTTARLVESLEDQIGLLRERRRALITAAVTGELRIPGVLA